jgi:hypothetical protein
VYSAGNVEVEEDEDEEEDSEEQPRRQQAVRRPATRGGGARQAKHAEGRRTGRERQRVCYNEDELLVGGYGDVLLLSVLL